MPSTDLLIPNTLKLLRMKHKKRQNSETIWMTFEWDASSGPVKRNNWSLVKAGQGWQKAKTPPLNTQTAKQDIRFDTQEKELRISGINCSCSWEWMLQGLLPMSNLHRAQGSPQPVYACPNRNGSAMCRAAAEWHQLHAHSSPDTAASPPGSSLLFNTCLCFSFLETFFFFQYSTFCNAVSEPLALHKDNLSSFV